MPDLPLIVVLPVLVGAVLLVLGLSMAVRRGRRRRDWTRTRGTVVGWRHRMNTGDGNGVAVPQVGFRTAEGREVTASLGYGVDLGVYPTGREVDVWYDPADPSRAQANVMGTGCVPHALVLLGLAVGGAGVMIGRAVL